MTRPIVLGLISEVLAACNEQRILRICKDIAHAVHTGEGADELGLEYEQPLFMSITLGDLVDAERFWENQMYVCALVASILESETQRVANPVLRAIEATAEERDLIIRCTDDVQVSIMNRLVAFMNEQFPVANVVSRAGATPPDSEVGTWTFLTRRY
jgi:hypothetical protein